MSINYPIDEGHINFNVEYVEGHEENPKCFIILFEENETGSGADETRSLPMNFTINGTSGTNTVPASMYDIIATDFDAKDEINIEAAVTIPGVLVPDYTLPITTGDELHVETALYWNNHAHS